MSQFWLLVNLDKKEFVDPHKIGVGLTLWDQVNSFPSTGTALTILCAAIREKRGSGDIEVVENAVGRWSGGRIAFVGDYAEDSDLPAEFEASKIFERCTETKEFTDISSFVIPVIEKLCDGTLRVLENGTVRFVKEAYE